MELTGREIYKNGLFITPEIAEFYSGKKLIGSRVPAKESLPKGKIKGSSLEGHK